MNVAYCVRAHASAWPSAPPSCGRYRPCVSVQAGPTRAQLRARLGRVIRDIRRKIEDDAVLEERFGPLLALAIRSGPRITASAVPRSMLCIAPTRQPHPAEPRRPGSSRTT
jgi:hypothetical protein